MSLEYPKWNKTRNIETVCQGSDSIRIHMAQLYVRVCT